MYLDKYSTAQEKASALRKLQVLEAEKAATEKAKYTTMLDLDLQSGKSVIRKAQAKDFP